MVGTEGGGGLHIWYPPPGTYLLPVLAVLYSETSTWWLLLGVANKQTCTWVASKPRLHKDCYEFRIGNNCTASKQYESNEDMIYNIRADSP